MDKDRTRSGAEDRDEFRSPLQIKPAVGLHREIDHGKTELTGGSGLFLVPRRPVVPSTQVDDGADIVATCIGFDIGRRRLVRSVDLSRHHDSEVTRHLVRERVFKPMMPPELGGGSPDSTAIRTARANIKQHMKYTNWLAGSRNWLAGPRLTYDDLAAAASLSVLDYLGEVDWRENNAARDWYARVKSRPSFRSLLNDRVRGISPATHYADLDF